MALIIQHLKWVEELFHHSLEWDSALAFAKECVSSAILANKHGLIVERKNLFWCSFVNMIHYKNKSLGQSQVKIYGDIYDSTECINNDAESFKWKHPECTLKRKGEGCISTSIESLILDDEVGPSNTMGQIG